MGLHPALKQAPAETRTLLLMAKSKQQTKGCARRRGGYEYSRARCGAGIPTLLPSCFCAPCPLAIGFPPLTPGSRSLARRPTKPLIWARQKGQHSSSAGEENTDNQPGSHSSAQAHRCPLASPSRTSPSSPARLAPIGACSLPRTAPSPTSPINPSHTLAHLAP
jgi:hypothetical protein